MRFHLRVLLGFTVLYFIVSQATLARAEDLVRVGGFTREAPSYIAESKGFFQAEGIRMEYSHVLGSVEMMRNFVSGKFDLIHTTADNVIAWADGRGLDPGKNDFIIFVGGRKDVSLDLLVAPGIGGFDGLKGKLLAVDAYNTGYAPVLVFMLKQHGLTLSKDYNMKPFGGGEARLKALLSGEAAGALLTLNEELRRKGFRILAQSKDYLPNYAVAIGAARRDWAVKHDALLVRYIRALVRSTDWLLDPKNQDEAMKILRAAMKDSPDRAGEMYEESLDPQLGWLPHLKIDRKGIQTILDLRQLMGETESPLPSPDKYIDERYYQKAIASMASDAKK
jgi:ABC-type nitrate/sulfonate/bicarbonate transport system substrate-binding protein